MEKIKPGFSTRTSLEGREYTDKAFLSRNTVNKLQIIQMVNNKLLL